jgi:protein-tyrosine phosphatase
MSYQILMVCMGNICRSPTAQSVLQQKLLMANLAGQVQVDSAGTHARDCGAPPDARALVHASRRGYQLLGLRAKGLAALQAENLDLILAMDADNLHDLRQHWPRVPESRLHLLSRYAAGMQQGLDIADPYYGGGSGFERVLDLIEAACSGLVSHLKLNLITGPAGQISVCVRDNPDKASEGAL